MSKFKPASAFNTDAPSAPTQTAMAAPQLEPLAPAQPLVKAAQHAAAVYQEPTPVSYVDMVLQKHQQRLQEAGTDVNAIRGEITKLAQSFDPRRPDAIHTLGSNSGAKVVQYSDKLLSQVKSKDLEGLGDNLNEVVLLAKGINIGSLVDSSKSKIPLIGSLIDSFKMNKEKVLGRYESLSKQIEKLVIEMKGSQ
nr:toxic anion resistance protein [Agitococcus sp.]